MINNENINHISGFGLPPKFILFHAKTQYADYRLREMRPLSHDSVSNPHWLHHTDWATLCWGVLPKEIIIFKYLLFLRSQLSASVGCAQCNCRHRNKRHRNICLHQSVCQTTLDSTEWIVQANEIHMRTVIHFHCAAAFRLFDGIDWSVVYLLRRFDCQSSPT